MQESLKHRVDYFRLVGHIIDHVPWASVDENTEEKSCDDTRNIWKDEFENLFDKFNLISKVYMSYFLKFLFVLSVKRS